MHSGDYIKRGIKDKTPHIAHDCHLGSLAPASLHLTYRLLSIYPTGGLFPLKRVFSQNPKNGTQA